MTLNSEMSGAEYETRGMYSLRDVAKKFQVALYKISLRVSPFKYIIRRPGSQKYICRSLSFLDKYPAKIRYSSLSLGHLRARRGGIDREREPRITY